MPIKDLIKQIEEDFLLTSKYTHIKKLSDKVKDVLLKIDRAKFVRDKDKQNAFLNSPLDIGYGQTISQPFIVALMTELLNVQKNDTVLEIGTGSGYQAAILSVLAKKVVTIERVRELYDQVTKRLQDLKFDNIKVILSDGSVGYEPMAPYDKIIVTAASFKIPPCLIDQLKTGGIMIIPLNIAQDAQMLTKIIKRSDNNIDLQDILPVRFVPLICNI